MIVVVTGNIGCGKSTVAKRLVEQLPKGQLFDYDQMVRDHYEYDENFTLMVAAVMGTSDKAEISNIVFNDRSKLQALRFATRPFTDAAMIKFIAKNQRSNIVLDIPLWFEDEMDQRFGCDYVVVVAADEESQIQRVAERSKWTEEKTRSVIANQLPQALKIDAADYVVSNMRDINMLYAQVDYFATEITTKEIK
jgi:dephospho-CoA kinase